MAINPNKAVKSARLSKTKSSLFSKKKSVAEEIVEEIEEVEQPVEMKKQEEPAHKILSGIYLLNTDGVPNLFKDMLISMAKAGEPVVPEVVEMTRSQTSRFLDGIVLRGDRIFVPVLDSVSAVKQKEPELSSYSSQVNFL